MTMHGQFKQSPSPGWPRIDSPFWPGHNLDYPSEYFRTSGVLGTAVSP